MLRRTTLFVLFCTFFAVSVRAQTDRQTILSILDRQTKAWNAGDIPGFMKGYWESDSLMYIGKSGIRYGYAGTLENYRKNYPDRAAMGTLKFDILHVQLLSKDAAFVVGKWHLTRPEKGDIGGHFSLTWRKIRGQWVITADHSS
ncbi:YybH family protein [Siphonobacter aquaeclarae]|jgi:ketosteroid isomerase-like protein|uniref:Ketosteroid isomerase homolog n=1 Tax=Siphonobacter aquaeclarae TaxID=563176 RepID=A0A1G9QCJ2_9BACT|nr:nuclear transport factor 2 family protein [Siphonobacter aquaeclarae]MBO9639234.1 nuclear transport factor 2 family protein [Siphonobacter aquaeclarae]SDM08451.1 Ketosteroid isomerase homolog [Siphonobacter aquaeclarae]